MNTFSRSQTPTSLADARVGLVLLFVVLLLVYQQVLLLKMIH